MKSLSLLQENSLAVYSRQLAAGSGSTPPFAVLCSQFIVGGSQYTVDSVKPSGPTVQRTAVRRTAVYRLLLTACCLLFTAHSLFAQSLSQDAKVSLITIAPGSSVFEGSGFGHSSIWVYDPANGISKNYNYGTFTFQTGNFLLKFVQGTLPYTLSVAPMEYVIPHYEAERRDMTEQVLNLSQIQKQRMYDFLENNALPQNREYKYRFFFDNCSSRIRDVLQVACGDSLVYYNKPIDGEAKSFRQWMNEYLVHKPWEKFLMNLGIGLPSDAIATPQQEMYLPYNLMHHFDRATLGGQPLVRITQPLVTTNFSHREQPSQPWWLSPTVFFCLLTAFVVWKTQQQQNRSKISLIFDKVFFSIIGLFGWILFGLATATDHGVTEWNLHLLWTIPLYFPLAFFLTGKKHLRWMHQFILISLGLLILYVVVVLVGSLLKGMFIGMPLEAWLLIFCLFYRLNFLRKRV